MANTDDEKFIEHHVSFRRRAIYLYGEDDTVDGKMAANAIKGLLLLDPKLEPITVYVNTWGGSASDGWAIYDAIRSCRSPVTTVAIGAAGSAGSVILQAGDTRLITPNTEVLIHFGYDSHGEDRITTLYAAQEAREHYIKRMEELFVERIREKHPGFPRRNVVRWLRDDKYFTADQAITYGLADKYY